MKAMASKGQDGRTLTSPSRGSCLLREGKRTDLAARPIGAMPAVKVLWSHRGFQYLMALRSLGPALDTRVGDRARTEVRPPACPAEAQVRSRPTSAPAPAPEQQWGNSSSTPD